MYQRLYGTMRIRIVGRILREYDRLASTNSAALELARDGATEGTVVIAREQTAGRGRLGRAWSSERDAGLYFSVILRPEPGQIAARERLSLAIGVAVVQVLRRLYGLAAEIKWPNDVLVGGRKIAGILIEAGRGPGSEEIVVGIGINTNWSGVPEQTDFHRPPTALSLVCGQPIDHSVLLGRVLEAIDILYAALRRGLFRAVLGRVRRHLFGIGHEVFFGETQAERRSGTVEGLDGEGRLLVRDGYGTIHALVSGEVRFADRS